MQHQDNLFILDELMNSEVNDNQYIYIYHSHMGGYYTSDKDIEYDNLYCETCGDFDYDVDSGTKGELVEKYSKIINDEKSLKEWISKEYPIQDDDYGYIKTIKGILGDDIKIEDDFWVVCPDDIDCRCRSIYSISDFKEVINCNDPKECKFCALQGVLSEIDY